MTQDRVIVVGGGPAGLLSALALQSSGVPTVLVTPVAPPAGTREEARTAALFGPSLALLETLGVFGACKAACAPMRGIRMIDARGGLLRAPEVLFTADEIGLETFGYNVPNGALNASVRGALAQAGGPFEWVRDTTVAAVTPDQTGVTVTLSDGQTLRGALVVAADGRNSVCREGAGISVKRHVYDQLALTAHFSHSRSHEGISTELHGLAGPCTTVPLPGRASSLVWIERPSIAARLMGLGSGEFITALESRLQGLLGSVSNLNVQGQFPLSWMQAERFAHRRVMLVGEAAHVMPPIGAQGLNLGLRDLGYMVDCVTDAAHAGLDVGGDDVLEAYHQARRGDITMRMTAVDALNRSLLSELGPIHLMRGAGLHALSALQPLRRAMIARGMAPSALPRMMQPRSSTQSLTP